MFRFLSSLKLAVVVILSLTSALIAGTLLESAYDIATARYWVYRAFWFHFVLFGLGVNIVCSALSRLPWKKRHLPFLLAHLGIILLLIGSWVTQKWGLDGSINISEGSQSSLVELGEYQLQLEHAGQRATIDFPWIPPHRKFSPITYSEYGFSVDQFLSHADPKIRFAPTEDKAASLALGLRLTGGPMQLDQEVWLWRGDASWSQMTLGPLKVVLLPEGMKLGSATHDPKQALIEIEASSKDSIRLKLISVRNEQKILTVSSGGAFETGWMGLRVSVEKYIPHAVNATEFTLSKLLYGDQAPPPAIHVRALNGGGDGMWMGLGDRVELAYGKQVLSMAYTQKRVMLPFGLRLGEFHIDHYEGTMNPSSFYSRVQVVDSSEHPLTKISMNEPLVHRGITFYQASYVPEEPRPRTSIFTVNQDPGRQAKYAGSFFLVLGVILLFGRRYLEKKKLEKSVKTTPVLALVLLCSTFVNAAELKPVPNWNWSVVREIPIQSGGRIKPLDSFARETVLFVTGSNRYQNWKQIEMILSWMSDPEAWANEPMIKIQNEDVKRQLLLDLGRNRYTANELVQNKALMSYAEGLARRERGVSLGVTATTKPDPREQEMKRILDRIGLFRTVVSGDAVTVIPGQSSQWSSLATQEKSAIVTRAIFAEMLTSYQKQDLDYFSKLAITAKTSIEKDIKNWGDSSPKLLSIEALYYEVSPFFWAMVLYLCAGGLWLISGNFMGSSMLKKPVVTGAWILTVAAFLLHAFGFTLRCIIAGRPPVSNMYESVIWVSFGVLNFGFILYFIQKQTLMPAVASIVAGLMLFAADASPAILDPNIHPLVPVLRSNYWLTIHVLTITLGYAGFALSLGIANVTLFTYFREPVIRAQGKVNFLARIDHLNLMAYRAMQFGVVLLAAGTILGGIWADYSWGRFWGWDPKEVWALIALLTYIAILHARFAGWVRSFGFAICTTLAFLSVIMAWYGVNFVLGVGLHSYGFSSGGGTGVMGFVIAQLVWVAVVAVTHQTKKPVSAVS